jgi:hypothetical protein
VERVDLPSASAKYPIVDTSLHNGSDRKYGHKSSIGVVVTA